MCFLCVLFLYMAQQCSIQCIVGKYIMLSQARLVVHHGFCYKQLVFRGCFLLFEILQACLMHAVQIKLRHIHTIPRKKEFQNRADTFLL